VRAEKMYSASSRRARAASRALISSSRFKVCFASGARDGEGEEEGEHGGGRQHLPSLLHLLPGGLHPREEPPLCHPPLLQRSLQGRSPARGIHCREGIVVLLLVVDMRQWRPGASLPSGVLQAGLG
jgi:hypothetical protein